MNFAVLIDEEAGTCSHPGHVNEDIKMIKSEFIEQRTNLMNLKMETKIISELRPLGIVPAKTPPIKIIISKD